MFATIEEGLAVYKKSVKHFLRRDKKYKEEGGDLQTLNIEGFQIAAMEEALGLTPEEIEEIRREQKEGEIDG